ncbi:MAG TPA: T9SS type A sorting domain-containing protein [Chitinophagaceae bacterium]|nr:T9SS type A sorting domain-containing protein [Chitinophagaceae bacterium]
MKKPALIVVAVLAIAVFFLFQRISLEESREKNKEHYQEGEESEEEERETGADKQLSMWFQAKAYPDPTDLSGKYQHAWEQYLELKNKTLSRAGRLFSSSNWTTLGPVTNIGGRILTIAVDPNNSNNLWAGSASGGIWKSTNAGSSWTPVATNLPVLGVSSIIIDPTNSNVIYAGTGEVYRADTSNIGFNVWKTRGTYGIGIIKSTNGGTSWTQVLTRTTSQLFAIQMLKFDPTNSNTVYACATDGLYRSTNNGTSWSKILDKIYVSDVAINPSNTDQIVAAIGNVTNADKGIYRTTNGSNASPTWVKITSGLPSFEGYIRLAQTGSSALYASIGVDGGTSSNELYQSSNFGLTWSAKSGSNHCSYQHWFAHDLAINPNNTDLLLIMGVNWYRYTSSTSSRTNVSTAGHADVHDIVFDPNVSNRVYVCHDGGISVSNNGGANFSTINNGLNATQFYASLGVSTSNANRMVGGLQDNNQVQYNGTSWNTISGGGGDGACCAIHPTNDNIILAGRDAKQIFRSTNGGSSYSSVTSWWGSAGDSRTAFVPPYAFSRSNPNVVYMATDNLHKSTNAGSSFSNNTLGSGTPTNFVEQIHKTGIALAVSPTDENKVYVSTSPFAQYDNDDDHIYVTGSPNVLKTTTGNTPFSSIKGSLPDRFIMDFAISSNSDDSVYVVLGGFGTSHVYLTPDGGTTWLSRGAGLPDVPFNAIVIDPVHQDYIYAGCDLGVYVSPDRGATWYDYNTGFYDATLVMDLQIDANNKLIAATHGKGVFRSDLYVHSLLPAVITDFNGTGYKEYNQLKWIVSQEQDVARYELERSTDGSSFARIGTVTARNSSVETSYIHNDYTTLFETYYRLKIIDNDGASKYSTIVFIRKKGLKSEFSVLGNPFAKEIVLKYKLSDSQKISVQLINESGALIRKEEYTATAGTGFYTIGGFEKMASGVYLLNIVSGTDHQVIKLLKK